MSKTDQLISDSEEEVIYHDDSHISYHVEPSEKVVACWVLAMHNSLCNLTLDTRQNGCARSMVKNKKNSFAFAFIKIFEFP